MAIYDLSYSKLESLLDRSFSPGTENAIIEAIKSAGIINPWSGKIGVDVVDTSGAQTLPAGVQILLDTGASNNVTVKTDGATLIAAGDGSVSIVDKGPGGDTLVGGAGSESLKVTYGDNLLIAGSGENTLIGGAGHDTLIGGGSSLLEAGSGASTLIGGLLDQTGGDASSQGRSFGGSGRGLDDGDGLHGSGQSGSGPTPSDTLMGGQGSDLLQVFHGDNLLIAGSGHDTIFGGDGHDTIMGGGHDTININYGDEFVQGGSGSDVVNVGLHGNDVIYGGHATTVDTDQSSTSIKSEVDVRGVTTITFSNHQVLTVSNVTIDFADGHKTIVH
jgi:Ca2+-binding RTX toxin-like protein